jgi:hypothetical protein
MDTELNKNDRRSNSPNYGKHGIQPFGGFPYYVTRIVPALYHMILLPSEWTEASLIDFASTQAGFNNLEACLALSQNHGLWFTPDGGGNTLASDTGGWHPDQSWPDAMQGISLFVGVRGKNAPPGCNRARKPRQRWLHPGRSKPWGACGYRAGA